MEADVLQQSTTSEESALDRGFSERMMFRCGRRTFLIRPHEVNWIAGEGNYSRIHGTSVTFLVREVIGALQKRLEPFGFFRVHRSVIVNLDRIVEVRRVSRYKHLVVLADGTQLPVSNDQRSELDRWLSASSSGAD